MICTELDLYQMHLFSIHIIKNNLVQTLNLNLIRDNKCYINSYLYCTYSKSPVKFKQSLKMSSNLLSLFFRSISSFIRNFSNDSDTLK